MDRIKEYVTLEAAYLARGETLRALDCPACLGGNSREKKFNITRLDDGLVYNCYRASCGIRGFIPTNGQLLQSKRDVTDDGLRPYHGTYEAIDDSLLDREYFRQRFGLSNWPSLAIGRNERYEYVFQVRDPYERVRGYLVRVKPWGGPIQAPGYYDAPPIGAGKSKLLMHARGPTQSVYLAPSIDKRIVLVEDHVSALKIRQEGLSSVALIGTNLDEQKVREIAQLQPTEVIIALDKDATSNAFKLARRWGLAFNKVRVAMLEQDIKDTEPHNVREVLGL